MKRGKVSPRKSSQVAKRAGFKQKRLKTGIALTDDVPSESESAEEIEDQTSASQQLTEIFKDKSSLQGKYIEPEVKETYLRITQSETGILLDEEVGDDAGTDAILDEDPFVKHLEIVLPDAAADAIKSLPRFRESELKWNVLGTMIYKVPEVTSETVKPPVVTPIQNVHIRANLLKNVRELKDEWSEKSTEVFSILNSYVDFHSFAHKSDLCSKRAYCIHILNHVLKTRSRVISHNAKLTRALKDQSEFRDQGFTRPKVLILVPFRRSALQIFEIMADLLAATDDMQVMNRKRFMDEFGWNSKDPVTNSDRPEDFREIFAGNTDDCFRIGIGIAKKTLKLFTEFYSADIIIASPLGLRMIIGNEGEKQYEYDFLSSIEILVMDQADIFLMQNWEHVTHIMKHLHRQPKETRNVDFTRVRSWTLNGWSQLYRQTVIFSHFRCPELQSLINRSCSNYAGSVTTKFIVANPTISSVVIATPHTFHRIAGNDFHTISDLRFKYFTEKVLPQFLESGKNQTMIFIPSYFDFVRIRNHMKREDISFVQICEYSSTSKVARARDLFFHGKKHFLLYTERFHFFRRYHVRGIHHLLFYELPHYPHYYSELCNMMITGDGTELHQFTADSLFSKFDAFPLSPVVGSQKASSMLLSDKPAHMFVTSPENDD